jgi:hypothetical protein
VRKYRADEIVKRFAESFDILHSHKDDCVSGWIRFCGTRNRVFWTMVKRLIIFKASLLPFSSVKLLDKLLMNIGFKPSQVCIVCRKR